MSEWSLTVTDLRFYLISGNLTTFYGKILGDIESALYLKDTRSGSGSIHSILVFKSLYNLAGDFFKYINVWGD